MELMLYKPAGYEKLLPGQLKQLPKLSAEFQRSFLEMLYTLYQNDYATGVEEIWMQLATSKNKTMALEYLANAGIFPSVSETDPFRSSLWFSAYQQRLKQTKRKKLSQEMFLDKSFLPGQVVLCSFQSADRNIHGYLMIRGENGRWLTDRSGQPYRFPQLARSISNLPYYLTNGNTPQGLYKITGFDTAHNNWIGPTTNLQMVMPFEYNNLFFGTDTSYNNYYSMLLGKPLTKYSALWESFIAGKIGRSEIIAHGTAIDPKFYKGQKFFPNTPSLGCLCSPEEWSEKGERVYSAQQDWINVLLEKKLDPRYLIVAEADF